MIRGIIWDDEPEMYMDELVEKFKQYEDIEITIKEDEGQFLNDYEKNGPWDFVITDLVSKSKIDGTQDPIAGLRIAREVRKKSKTIPIFIVTEWANKVDVNAIEISNYVILKDKATPPRWMVCDIRTELKNFGILVNPNKVFLIYGHEKECRGIKKEIENYLINNNVQPVTIEPDNLFTEIGYGLLQKMNDCAAFIAICTPDDEILGNPNYFQPRPNVLLEIGLAMGLSRGIHRLTILQKWGSQIVNQATLPSDLGGVINKRFENFGNNELNRLGKRLKALRVSLT